MLVRSPPSQLRNSSTKFEQKALAATRIVHGVAWQRRAAAARCGVVRGGALRRRAAALFRGVAWRRRSRRRVAASFTASRGGVVHGVAWRRRSRRRVAASFTASRGGGAWRRVAARGGGAWRRCSRRRVAALGRGRLGAEVRGCGDVLAVRGFGVGVASSAASQSDFVAGSFAARGGTFWPKADTGVSAS